MRLKEAMLEKHITVKDIARVCKIHRNTASLKASGKLSFSVKEALLIQTHFFPECSIALLFSETPEDEKEPCENSRGSIR